ncbi:hypothetical protein C1645_861295 [Glomus cerebriforme]|uniref:Uncharacterized protein n=1 Tax=Glomus cerebriforme TaxID=658196 RepID=A0A397SGP5_9GLOM|nr:hypothetical protein C1645_861295 [Glomus cerebriforme]
METEIPEEEDSSDGLPGPKETPSTMNGDFLKHSYRICTRGLKEEEGTNESIEKVSKKSEVIAKALEEEKPLVSIEDYDDVYFDEEDLKEEEGELNEIKSDNEVIIIVMEDTKGKSHQ